MRSRLTISALAALLAVSIAAPLSAQSSDTDTLIIGTAGGTTSIDPHFHQLVANNSISQSVFDPLVRPDENMRPVPGLAESWRQIDDLTWEFTLREATFHDGTPVTADDVLFSFERGMAVQDSPSNGYIAQIQGKTIVPQSDRLLHIVTDTPQPTLLESVSTFAIVSRKHATDATREDFNSGRAAIGSGPYRFIEWVPGSRVVLERYDDYWGEKPEFARVIMRPIESGPTRVAALVAGDVDAIELVPTTDVARLESMPEFRVVNKPAKRVMYIHLDNFREDTPDIVAHDGSKIKSPILDARVRWALALGIDREAIAEYVMEGAAIPAGQYAPEGSEGASPNLKPIPYDPDRAKELLAEAGYPDGFKLRFHSTGDRFPNDVQVAEAIGQMWTRIGVDTEVVTMPAGIFYRRGTSGGPDGTPEFSVLMAGCCSSTGAAITPLIVLMATRDAERGRGSANRGLYSNPELDALLDQGVNEMNDEKRDAVIARATELAIEDMAVIPVHFLVNTWAMRNGIDWHPSIDDVTLPAQAVRVN
ncbi:MAG: ABC transporter substrate-binding protein [Salinarimonadaceae bacterium]|nr:MAG: ABC transporter substrate-binding protein [Salinarimonadaceae bacterium]